MILSTSERIKELREKNGYTQAHLQPSFLLPVPALMHGKWGFPLHLLKISLN